MSRIVRKSNCDKEWYDEVFVLWPMPEEEAEEIVDVLDRYEEAPSEHYYAVEDDDYKLYKGIVSAVINKLLCYLWGHAYVGRRDIVSFPLFISKAFQLLRSDQAICKFCNKIITTEKNDGFK